MDNLSDIALLQQYAGRKSETAFAALVSRHVNLVYSAALRKTGNPDAAEEITQAVFVILAQKAGRISPKTILPGWLYQTARLTASSFLKSEARRARREQEAYMQTELHSGTSDETWAQLAPLLEDAMGQLDEKERAAVVLRFFGGKSFSEVAMASGISENAATKRVGRALEKLHRYFSRRGVASTTAIIAGAISANSVQVAPAALAKAVTAVAIAKGAAASGSSLTLIKGALKIMAWTKAKTAIVVGVVALAAGTTPIVIGHYQSASNDWPFKGPQTARPASVHLSGQLRTFPGDNFGGINADTAFQTIELWEQFDPELKWRVEKPARVVVMDGQSTVMLMGDIGVKLPQRTPSAFDTEWLHRIARLSTGLTNELKTARAKGWKVKIAKETGADGKLKSVVTIKVKSGLAKTDYTKNFFLDNADTRRVYRFDVQSKLLESVRIYLDGSSGDKEIFTLSRIEYDQPIDPSVWKLELPTNVTWLEEPKKLPDNEKYAAMTAEQAARAFLEACSTEDWKEAAKFDSTVNDQLKQAYGGLQIINLGKAFTSKAYGGRFVPYEIKLRPQEINVRVANTNSAKRFVLTGVYDSKLKLAQDLKLTAEPETLPNNDVYARMSAKETVQAYFDAQSKLDWTEMRKFTSEADVQETKAQAKMAEKQGMDIRKMMPVFEVGEAVWSPEQSAWFVKCTVIQTKKWNMAIRKDNPVHRWQVDGGI